MLLDAQIGLATTLAREVHVGSAGPVPVPSRMTHVKMRAFIVPGQEVETLAEVSAVHEGMTRIALSARDGDGKTIATARVEFAVAGA